MSCKLCSTRPVPSCYGSPRKCAFDDSGNFTGNNWNCETANELRELMEAGSDEHSGTAYRTRYDDESIGVLATENHGFIVATWYKERGRTGQIVLMCDANTPRPITVDEAESILEWRRGRGSR